MRAIADIVTPLFVPGDRPERFKNAATCGADAVIIDLEDAVGAMAKEGARSTLQTDFTSLPVLVRVNAIGTLWHEADIAAVSRLPVAGVVLPKAESGSAFRALCTRLPVPVLALVETAQGIASAREIAATRNVLRLAFGSIDYCANLGCGHTREALLSARSELVLASRLASIAPPVDGVTIAIDDVALIEDDARHGNMLGFGGKLAIHPRQIAAIAAGFSPSHAETDWARRVLSSGDGAVAVDGVMVDEPIRIRARRTLRLAGRDQHAIAPDQTQALRLHGRSNRGDSSG